MALYLYDDPGTLYDTATYDSVLLTATVGQPLVELLLNGVWTDVTVFVRTEAGIQITRGRSDEQSTPVPATCSLTFENGDGRFTPSYTSGAYYPYVMRNTQLRVSVLLDDLVTYSVRFWGEVAEWPISYDLSATDVTVSVTAAGPRRRLARLAAPTASAYTIAEGTQTAVLAYWPMEDGASATQFANALGGAPGSYTGAPALASDDTWAASDPLPVFTGIADTASFTVPAYTPSVTGQQVRWWAKVPTVATSGNCTMLVTTSGAHYFQVDYDSVGGTATYYMKNITTGILEFTSSSFTVSAWFRPGVRLCFTLKQNGTGIDANFMGYTPGDHTGFNYGVQTIPAATVGFVTGVGFANSSADVVSTIGQLSVENQVTSQYDLGVLTLNAYNGETAYARALRVEPTATLTGTAASTETMGVQLKDTALNLFDEAAFVDGGVSSESVTAFTLAWRSRASLLSQVPTPSLAVTRLTDLQQTTDDQNTQNDVTVTRINGASARRVATSGLTPAAVGTYAAGYDLSLSLDSQTGPQAEWRMTLGSLDRPRYPVVEFDAISGLSAGLRTQLVAVREGFTFAVSSVGGEYLGLVSPTVLRCLGWSETFLPGRWLWTINATHGAPFSEVFILDDTGFGLLNTNRLGM